MIRRALVLLAVVVGVVLSAPAAHAQYQPGTPGLAVIPSVASPGQTVQVQGFGCPRNSPVTISIDGVQVATTTAGDNSEGSFQTSITAPSTAGTYSVVAQCGPISVLASLTVQDVSNPPGGTDLPATGSGSTLTLVRIGLGLVAAGGFVVLALRQRRTRV